MSSKSFGGTIKLQGESEYRKALTNISSNLKVLTSEMKVVESQYDKNDKSASNLTKQNEVLNKKIQEQKDKVEILTKALEDSKTETGENSETSKKWQVELNNAKAELNKLEKTVDDNTKSMDDFGESEEDASEKGLKLGDVIKAHLISDVIKTGLRAVADGMRKVVSSLEEWSDMSNALKEQEAKLTRVMRNTTNATDEQIQSIIDLTAKEEKLGVVSQETQLAGLQELGTYIEHKESLEKLLPVMNDMIAQQYGIGASMESASSIATMMGKVLGNGQVSALSKLGYKFDKTQEKVLKFGTEEQKAAMLAEVITQSVGGMNRALAQTDAGKMAIANSVMDDYKKTAGETYTTIKNKLVLALSNSLIPVLKTATESFKNWAASVNWTEVGKKITSAIKGVVSVFKWFVDNRKPFIAAIGAMLAAFAVVKITEFAGAFGAVISGLKTAGGLLPTVTALLQKLNLTALANPYVALAAGIAAVGAALVLWIENSDNATEAEKRHKEQLDKLKVSIDENCDSWENLKQKSQEYVDTNMSELSHYESLADELDTIVDKNGKVKKGYEDRANFIVTTLNDALGTEIKLNGNVIKNYKNIQNEIDKLIEKKKAQIILNANEEKYTEAIKNQESALKDLNETNKILQEQEEEREKLVDEWWEVNNRSHFKWELAAIDRKIEKKDEEIQATRNAYKQQENLLSEYAYNISQYENNAALFHKGKYDEMSTVNWDYVKDYQNAENAEMDILQDKIDSHAKNLELLKRLNEQSGDDIYKTQIDAEEKQIKALQKQMQQYLTITGDGLDNVKIEWNDSTAEQLKSLVGYQAEFKDLGDGYVQMYIKGVAQGEPKSKEEMAKLVTETIKEVSKQESDSEKAGQFLIDGVNKGITNQNKQSSVFKSISNFGSKILSKLKSSLQEKSPSKATNEMGQFLDEGIVLGIKQKSKNVLVAADSLGKSVLGTLNSSLSKDLEANRINIASQLNKPNFDYLSGKNRVMQDEVIMVDAFKRALKEVKVVMNGKEMGQFVTNTIEKEVFS